MNPAVNPRFAVSCMIGAEGQRDVDASALEGSEVYHSRSESYARKGTHFPEIVRNLQGNQLERDINRRASFERRGNGETLQFIDVDGVVCRVYRLSGNIFAQDVYGAIPPMKVCSDTEDLPRALPLLRSRVSSCFGDFVKRMAEGIYST